MQGVVKLGSVEASFRAEKPISIDSDSIEHYLRHNGLL